MTADANTPECEHGAHRFCPGPQVVRREGAPSWEAPVEVLRCGCSCHPGNPPPRRSRRS